MCGRYTLTTPQESLLTRFGLTAVQVAVHPRYNIAPTQPVAVVFDDAPDTLSSARWGLLPAWQKDTSGPPLINARAETLRAKPSFRESFRQRRCWVLCDGFYEWRKNQDGTRTPFRAILKDGGPFALAGLWDERPAPDGSVRRSCTVVTTQANPLLASVHERMPVILPPEDERRWLEDNDLDRLERLLRPYPAEAMQLYPVSRAVNVVTNDDASLIAPMTPEPHQTGLF
ncbi:SOS response-associated peptidase [Chloracidobacterium sp. MS 40/45]|jgi:putative SOS response-associated peptidase YedK|uniref:SOS response-associated peptidase n=1 Tax=Chloracidobacterium aggregatum TaxID=2851959 RepID=UPI001B8BF76B|nr:SOS response-associated peptidase [Chloracidobacterium aggregatum]QUW01675.1 SOS response-associated peptidase [Chloracidobacterium sp. MS 40/45]